MSRMWGSALDHIVELEVVTANGTIVRANEQENSDLFYVRTNNCLRVCISTYHIARVSEEPAPALALLRNS